MAGAWNRAPLGWLTCGEPSGSGEPSRTIGNMPERRLLVMSGSTPGYLDPQRPQLNPVASMVHGLAGSDLRRWDISAHLSSRKRLNSLNRVFTKPAASQTVGQVRAGVGVSGSSKPLTSQPLVILNDSFNIFFGGSISEQPIASALEVGRYTLNQ